MTLGMEMCDAGEWVVKCMEHFEHITLNPPPLETMFKAEAGNMKEGLRSKRLETCCT